MIKVIAQMHTTHNISLTFDCRQKFFTNLNRLTVTKYDLDFKVRGQGKKPS